MKLTPALLRASWRSWTSNDLQRAGPWWLQLVWTGLFGCTVGLLFTLAGFAMYARRGADWTDLDQWGRWLGPNLYVSLFIAFLVHALFEVLIRLVGPARIRGWKEWQRGLFFSAVPLAGVAIGWPTAVALAGYRFAIGGSTGTTSVSVSMMLFALMFSLLTVVYFSGVARAHAAERRAAEAQLKLLQGQIEPHFLFNTLANVVGLIDADPARARRMLESFIDYLRGSLGGLRGQRHTLGAEVALIEAYLRVLALRMDERLRVRIEVPPDLHAAPLPALLVQPLVENAIHHGLEPKVEGGELVLRAAVQGAQLVIEVLDDGLGLRPGGAGQGGSGAALANTRERLQAAYGEGARLSVENRPAAEGGGVRARLTLPWPLPQT